MLGVARLVDLEEFDVEVEGGVGRDDATDAAGAVGVLGGAHDGSALADRKLGNALIPAADDLAPADGEDEGLVAVAGRVELSAVGQGASVVDGDLVTRL